MKTIQITDAMYEYFTKLADDLRIESSILGRSDRMYCVMQTRLAGPLDERYRTSSSCPVRTYTLTSDRLDLCRKCFIKTIFKRQLPDQCDKCSWTWYEEYFEHVRSFFTKKAADIYIEDNQESMRKPFVFTETLQDNKEMQNIKYLLFAISNPPTTDYVDYY